MIILAAGVFLYAWICFLFLFSTHLLVTSFAQTISYESDGAGAAWALVWVIGIAQAAIFVALLYGIQLNLQTLAVALLVLAIMIFLFVANYTESEEGEPHVISFY